MYKGKAVDTKTLVEYSADSIVSKTLIDTKVGTSRCSRSMQGRV